MIFSVSHWIATYGVYLTNAESRYKLLIQGIEINNTTYQFYDTNPYTSGAKSVKPYGLPLSVADSAVCEMFDRLNVKLTSKILYESILNGTRFLFIDPLPDGKSLPRFNYCAGVQCKIFDFGQPKKNQEICFVQTVGRQITQGLNAPRKHVVK